MTHRLFPSFFQGKHLAILGLMAISLLSFGLSQAFAQTTITLDTTKNSYRSGDLVEVKGQVADSPNKLVAVQVKDPTGNIIMVRAVKTDSDGNFVLKFKLPSTASSGNYNVIADSNVGGKVVKKSRIITAAIVPEFPFALFILMGSITQIIVFSRIKLRK